MLFILLILRVVCRIKVRALSSAPFHLINYCVSRLISGIKYFGGPKEKKYTRRPRVGAATDLRQARPFKPPISSLLPFPSKYEENYFPRTKTGDSFLQAAACSILYSIRVSLYY